MISGIDSKPDEAELELDVVFPDFLHERHDPLGDHAHGEALDRRERAIEDRRLGAAAEQAVDEEVGELAADVDHGLLTDGVVARPILDVEDERVAARAEARARIRRTRSARRCESEGRRRRARGPSASLRTT